MEHGLTLLLVTDHPAAAEEFHPPLDGLGVRVLIASDPVQARGLLLGPGSPDAVLVDLDFALRRAETLAELRVTRDVPVLLLSEPERDDDLVRASEWGADGCLIKPTRAAEVRVRAAVATRLSRPHQLRTPLEVAGLRLDPQRRIAVHGNREIPLTPREFAILYLLAENADSAISKQEIFELVWRSRHHGDLNLVEQHISNLRAKIDLGGPLIQTVRGVGYLLRGADD